MYKTLQEHFIQQMNEELFEAYTPKDHEIFANLAKMGCYLIGGTAIDYWCKKLNFIPARHRSNNDLDFTTWIDNKQLNNVIIYLKDNGFDIPVSDNGYQINAECKSPKIEVDILIDRDMINKKMFILEGVMSPVYLFISKFDRYVNTPPNTSRWRTDKQDLCQLLSIINKMNKVNELEKFLIKKNYSKREEDILNKLITYYNGSPLLR